MPIPDQPYSELLQQLLHGHVPAAKFMGIALEAYDGRTLSLTAPFGPNRNMHQTAFAGSLFSIAALSVWGLLYLKLREAGQEPNIVISKSEISYKQPVVQNIRATASIPDTASFEHFLKTVAAHQQSKITLDSKIMAGQRVAVDFQGTLVVS